MLTEEEPLLIHGDCLEVMKSIPDGSVDMVLCDPPYVRMVAEKWDRMSELYYNNFFDEWKKEAYRVLRFGGRFLSFSSNDTLSYLYGGGLLHRELLVIDKDARKVSAGRNTKKYRQHINSTEYVYVATKFAREYVRKLLLNQKGSKTSKEINQSLGLALNGGGMWSIYTGNNICQQVPTSEQWSKFKVLFPSLPEYRTFEEIFNNGLGKGNVLRGYDFNIKKRHHPTQKPIALLEYLIKTYTNEGAVVIDNTMGSGSTGVACINTNRKFIGIEKDEKYFKISQDRIYQALVEKDSLLDSSAAVS
jgi:site-specific DNA-methyltransferase (adenine-specific)